MCKDPSAKVLEDLHANARVQQLVPATCSAVQRCCTRTGMSCTDQVTVRASRTLDDLKLFVGALDRIKKPSHGLLISSNLVKDCVESGAEHRTNREGGHSIGVAVSPARTADACR
jgi:hypothetical protein